MLKPILLIILILGTSSNVFANCKGVWELKSLVATQQSHLLLSDKNNPYQVSSDALLNFSNIHERIDRAAGIYTRFLICNSDEPNAYAWKEGAQNLTAISLGMIKLLGDDYAAYAALMGHENAHLTQGHLAKKKNSSIGFGILQVLAGIALEVAIQGAGGASGIGADIASIGTQAFSASYSRTHEHEADRFGLQYSLTAGFSPEGAIRLHEKLNSSGGFLSTHPSSGERTAELRKLMQEMGVLVTQTQNSEVPKIITQPVLRGGDSFGMVVTAKHRLGYYIGTQTSSEEPQPNMRVAITYETGEKLEGTIKKVINGYFSVVTDKKFTRSIEGGSISIIQ